MWCYVISPTKFIVSVMCAHMFNQIKIYEHLCLSSFYRMFLLAIHHVAGEMELSFGTGDVCIKSAVASDKAKDVASEVKPIVDNPDRLPLVKLVLSKGCKGLIMEDITCYQCKHVFPLQKPFTRNPSVVLVALYAQRKNLMQISLKQLNVKLNRYKEWYYV